MKLSVENTIMVIVVHIVICVSCFGQEGDNQPISNDVQIRVSDVSEELRGFGGEHPWAGIYNQPAGTDSVISLWIAPENGIAFKWQGNSKIVGEGIGKIEYREPVLRINWQASTYPLEALSTELLVVQIGSKLHLVPPREVHAVCLNPMSDFVRFHSMTRLLPAIGTPATKTDLKGDYAAYVDFPPVRATITKIEKPKLFQRGKYYWVTQTVTLDVGTSGKLIPGCCLVGCANPSIHLRVIDIEETSCTAELECSYDQRNGFFPLSIGAVFQIGDPIVDPVLFKNGLNAIRPEGTEKDFLERNGKYFLSRSRGQVLNRTR